MTADAEKLIDVMTSNCAQMYKLSLTTPTFTKEELRMKAQDIETSKHEAEARDAALRAARGLEPVVQKGAGRTKKAPVKPKKKQPQKKGKKQN
jgi:hypothetical protein